VASHQPPLRIANVMLGRGLGGLEQALLDHNDALTLTGHDVLAVIHPDAAIRPAIEVRGVSWHGIAHLGGWDMVAALRLRRLFQRFRPDVCLAHGNRAMSLLRLARAAPVIAVLPNYKMKCGDAAGVFYPTQSLRQYAQGQGVAPSTLHHIPSMVRVPPAVRPRRAWQTPTIGAMGRFVPKKGFDLFIDALGGLRQQGLHFRAVLAGDGDQRATLEQQAQASGLRDVLAFPGWITDRHAFFDGIDVFCLPSHHEPFGIVLLEAMAQGMPVVATASEGPAEILHDGIDGDLVPKGDAVLLARALQRAIADPARGARLGEAAWRCALETYDLPRVAQRIDRAVRDVVAASRALAEASG
jgi:glycosyltransferase involved in cell wall biosynthesis